DEPLSSKSHPPSDGTGDCPHARMVPCPTDSQERSGQVRTMPGADVRLARAADAAEIARRQHITWQTAYSELIDEESLAALIGPEAERQWTEAIEYADTDVFIASEGDFTVGFCVSGPAPREEIEGPDGTLPPDAEHTGLIGTILVEPRWGR